MKSLISPAGCVVLLLACGAPTMNFERLHVGMSEDEAMKIMGTPTSTAMSGNVKYLEFDKTGYDAMWWTPIRKVFFVRLINGRVDSYGQKGDFDSTKNPTKDININQKIERVNTEQAAPPAPEKNTETKTDLAMELKKLEKLKAEGTINEEEYQRLRRRVIDGGKL